jgi:hypothetical protein
MNFKSCEVHKSVALIICKKKLFLKEETGSTVKPLIFAVNFLTIGLEKLEERAKGINHPKHSVKPECACLKRESANSQWKS